MENPIRTSNTELIRQQLAVLDELERVKLELIELQIQRNELKKIQSEINNKLVFSYPIF